MEKKINFWITGLILLVLFFVSITGWSVFSARKGASSVVDPKYYDQGRRYNQLEDERKAAEAMGWKTDVVITGRQVTVRLATPDNTPVRGCRGHIYLQKATSGIGLPVNLEMQESAPGIYSVVLPVAIAGSVPAQLSLGKQGVMLKRRVLLNITSES